MEKYSTPDRCPCPGCRLLCCFIEIRREGAPDRDEFFVCIALRIFTALSMFQLGEHGGVDPELPHAIARTVTQWNGRNLRKRGGITTVNESLGTDNKSFGSSANLAASSSLSVPYRTGKNRTPSPSPTQRASAVSWATPVQIQ